MKQNIYIEKTAFSPNGQNIKEVVAGFEKPKHLGSLTFKDCSTAAVHLPAMLMDRDSLQLGRDGPPGRARSPGITFLKRWPTGLFPAIHSTIIQPNIIKQKFNHLQTLNFQIMKKQILLLVMALVTTVTVSFGQAPNLTQAIASCPAPTVITAACVASAGKFSPIAGTQYTYTANVPTTVGAVTYHWFVTKDLNLIATGGALTAAREAAGTSSYVASGSGTYNTVSNATAPSDVSVDITWKAFTHNPLTPVLLVVYVVDAAGCVNDNIEAFLIRPVHAFTLDIANLNATGGLSGANYPTCVSEIETATYAITNVATGEGRIEFEYGTNYMFFIVTAANYTDSWLPRFQVDGAGLSGSRRVTAVDWAYPHEAFATATTISWKTMTGAGTAASIFTGTAKVAAQASTGSVGSVGECIVVRLTIENNQDETIIDEAITLAVDGVMNDPTTAAEDYTNIAYADIHHAAGPASECPYFDVFTNDVATQILTARPNINEISPDTFVPTNRD